MCRFRYGLRSEDEIVFLAIMPAIPLAILIVAFPFLLHGRDLIIRLVGGAIEARTHLIRLDVS